jgi:predicted nucleic acid-binding protein
LTPANPCVELFTRHKYLHPILDGQSSAIKARLEQHNPQDVKLCSVVKAELLYGAAKSTIQQRTLASLNRFFDAFASLLFDDRAAEAYGTIRADLERQGTPIGPELSALSVQLSAIPQADR